MKNKMNTKKCEFNDLPSLRENIDSDLTFSIFARQRTVKDPIQFFSLLTDEVLDELGRDAVCEELTVESSSDSSRNESYPSLSSLDDSDGCVLNNTYEDAVTTITHDNISTVINDDKMLANQQSPRNELSFHSTPKSGQPLVFGFSPTTPLNSVKEQEDTPIRIALSLGATMGDHELSWSRSMETPSVKSLRSKEASFVKSGAQSNNSLPKHLFERDAEDDMISSNLMLLTESVDQGLTDSIFDKEPSVVESLHAHSLNENISHILETSNHEVDIMKQPSRSHDGADTTFELFSTTSDYQDCEHDAKNEELSTSKECFKKIDEKLSETVDPLTESECIKGLLDAEKRDDVLTQCQDEELSNVTSIDHSSQVHCKMCCSQGGEAPNSGDKQEQPNAEYFVLLNDVPPGMYQVVCDRQVHLTTSNDLTLNKKVIVDHENKTEQIFSDCCDELTNDDKVKSSIRKGAEKSEEKDGYVKSDDNIKSTASLARRNSFDCAFKGFSTASGKSVKISEEAFCKAKRMLEDDLKLHEVDFSDCCESDSKLNDLGASEKELNNRKKEDRSFGFSTASGKSICVSDEALNKAQSIFNDVLEEDRYKQLNHSPQKLLNDGVCKSIIESTSSCDKIQTVNKFLNNYLTSNRVKNLNQENKFSGFTSGSGKAITVNEDSLVKAKKIFENCDMEFEFEKAASAKSENYGGFSTAAGKKIVVSEEALLKAKETLLADDKAATVDSLVKTKKISDIDNSNLQFEKSASANSENCYKGFCTAGGEKIVVSEEALLKAKETLLADEDELDLKTGITNIINKDSQVKAKKLIEDIVVDLDCEKAVSTTSKNNFGEFSTASGKKINVSEEALLKAKETLSVDENALDFRPEIEPEVVTNEIAKNIKICDILTPERRVLINKRRLDINTEFTLVKSKVNTSTQDWDDIMADADDEEAFSNIYTSPFHKSNKSFIEKSSEAQLSVEIQLSTAALLADETELNDENNWLSTQQSVSTKNKRKGIDLSATPRRSKRLRGKGSQVLNTEKPVVQSNVLQTRLEVIKLRMQRLIKKQKEKVPPVMGALWVKKHENKATRVKLKEFAGGLPKRLNSEESLTRGIMKSVLNITSVNAEEYCFLWEEASTFAPISNGGIVHLECGAVLIFSDDDRAGKEEFYDALIDTHGIDSNLISKKWVFNHYRWIVWKLSSLEKSFPEKFGGRLFNPDTVMNQLQYRYNCEIDHCQRSIIKKLYEQDDTPTKTMVLCVANIINETSRIAPNGGITGMELTDGWYKIKALVDDRFRILILSGKIFVGLKIVIFGCEFSSVFDACDPLEAPQNASLQLAANCCRKVRWDTKLGARYTSELSLPICSVFADGGRVPSVDILVARVYPMLYLEKNEDGSFTTYNDRTNDRAARLYEANRSAFIEDVSKKVLIELEDQEEKKKRRLTRRSLSKGNLSVEQIANLNNAEEISSILESSADPSSIESCLSDYQKSILVGFRRSVDNKKRSLVEREIENKSKTFRERNVVPFFKFAVVGLHSSDLLSDRYCTVTIWKPSSDLISLIKEGKSLRILNLNAEKKRDDYILNLKSTKHTVFQELKKFEELLKTIFIAREPVPFNQISCDFKPTYGLVDIVGVVIKSRLKEHSRFDCVYVADAEMNIVIIKFWNGLKAFSLEDFLIPETFVSVANLQWRGKSNFPFHCLFANEVTVFTQRPRDPKLKLLLDELEKSVTSDRQFFENANQKINNLTKDSSFGHTPIVIPTIGKPMSSSTPLNRCANMKKLLGDGSLTEHNSISPLNQPNVSLTEKKLQALKHYGEPPPLLQLSCENDATRKQFKPPVKSNKYL